MHILWTLQTYWVAPKFLISAFTVLKLYVIICEDVHWALPFPWQEQTEKTLHASCSSYLSTMQVPKVINRAKTFLNLKSLSKDQVKTIVNAEDCFHSSQSKPKAIERTRVILKFYWIFVMLCLCWIFHITWVLQKLLKVYMQWHDRWRSSFELHVNLHIT